MTKSITDIENDVRVILDQKVSYLGELVDTEECDYVLRSLHRMYEMMVDHGQYLDGIRDPKIVKAKRVIKCNRYIPNYVLDIYEAERVILGGLYVLADVYVLPTDIIRKNMRRNRNCIRFPEVDGLPPESEVYYGTTKQLGHFSIALAKSSWLTDWITYSSQYDYVRLTV